MKNPHFRYNGYPPAPPPGSHVRSPTETYYANLCAQQQQQQMEMQSQTMVNNGNPISLAAAAAAVVGGVGMPNNNSGQINYRNSPVYTMNQATGFLAATGSIPNVVQTIPLAVANDNLLQNQPHSMQLSPQPVNQSSLEFGRFMTSNHSQIASSMLRSVNIPSATPVIEPLTNVSGSGIHTNESVYYNPVISSNFGDSCFAMNNVVNPSKNWNSGICSKTTYFLLDFYVTVLLYFS